MTRYDYELLTNFSADFKLMNFERTVPHAANIRLNEIKKRRSDNYRTLWVIKQLFFVSPFFETALIPSSSSSRAIWTSFEKTSIKNGLFLAEPILSFDNPASGF